MKTSKEKELIELAINMVEKPSKLTEEQVIHFKKKGKFSATYTPYTIDDISSRLKCLRDQKVIIYCNYEIIPCINVPQFFGQYKFFIEDNENQGWCPEIDFSDIQIIDDYAKIETWNDDHKYLIIINDRAEAIKAFGNYGKTCDLPSVVGRSYDLKSHDYVKKLAENAIFLYKYKDSKWKKF